MEHKGIIVSEGLPFIIPLAVITLLLAWFHVSWASAIFAVLTAFVTWFFRNPVRVAPEDECVVVSPADGLVIKIDEYDYPVISGKSKRVSIFLNIFDVHVNWSPVPGVIRKIVYGKGKFHFANLDKASLDNERNTFLIDDNQGRKIAVIQIAGIIARRIVCWAREGMSVGREDRIGMIRFGSRVEVFMPLDSEVLVKVGQRVKGGATPIGRLQ
jgi:phosphatidylserine decarboxylase